MVRRLPSQRTAGLISAISGYREMARGRFSQREAAPLAIPLIISFGTPFTIALGREPDAADRQDAPMAASPRDCMPAPCTSSPTAAPNACRWISRRSAPISFFGGAVVDLAARMIGIDDVLGGDGARLRERLGATTGWQRRFDIVEDFVADRANHLPSPELEFAYRQLARSGGGIRIATLAEEIGWSRKHLVDRFRSEFGLGPKSLARMMRFHRACRLARTGTSSGWAGIAADSGFSDQAHLVREFTALAGEPPTAWARRLALTDSRLTRPQGAISEG